MTVNERPRMLSNVQYVFRTIVNLQNIFISQQSTKLSVKYVIFLRDQEPM